MTTEDRRIKKIARTTCSDAECVGYSHKNGPCVYHRGVVRSIIFAYKKAVAASTGSNPAREVRNRKRPTVAEMNRLVRDLRDCFAAVQTQFVRCKCGRLAEKGIICPTNMEGGTCEAGR